MAKRVLPGFTLTLGCTLLYLAIIILIPLAALFLKSSGISGEEFWRIISSPRAVATYRVTLTCAAIATVFNGFFGFLMAWVLVRYEFPGRSLIDALMDFPFALPTAVAGIALTSLFASNGWYGQFFAEHGIKIAYTPIGITIAMAFTSVPFVVRTVQPVLEDMNDDAEQAAQTMGATDWQIFSRVIFPVLLPAFLAGCSLSFARSLGEFGAIIFIAGNLPMKTEITALLAFIRLEEFEYEAAAALATVMLAMAFVMLFITNTIQATLLRYTRTS